MKYSALFQAFREAGDRNTRQMHARACQNSREGTLWLPLYGMLNSEPRDSTRGVPGGGLPAFRSPRTGGGRSPRRPAHRRTRAHLLPEKPGQKQQWPEPTSLCYRYRCILPTSKIHCGANRRAPSAYGDRARRLGHWGQHPQKQLGDPFAHYRWRLPLEASDPETSGLPGH